MHTDKLHKQLFIDIENIIDILTRFPAGTDFLGSQLPLGIGLATDGLVLIDLDVLVESENSVLESIRDRKTIQANVAT